MRYYLVVIMVITRWSWKVLRAVLQTLGRDKCHWLDPSKDERNIEVFFFGTTVVRRT